MRAAHKKYLIATVACLMVTPVFSQGPQQETPRTQQQPAAQQQGADQTLLVIEIKQPAQAQNKSEANTPERPKERSQSWLASWGLSDKIAAIASTAAALQFGALVATIWVMVSNGRRQLRAYVFPDNAGIFDGSMLDPPMQENINKPGVVLNFKNSGQTPAYKVVSWAMIDVLPRGDEEKLIAPPLLDQFSNNIGPGGTMPKTLWYRQTLTAEEIEEIGKATKIIYLFGRIEYRDAFKKKRWSNFRFAYAGRFPPPKGVIFSLTEHGNDAN
jgi:hypothetical protein